MSKPVGPYTPVVRAGEHLLVVSGQVGIRAGALAEGLEGQLRQALDNLRGLLEVEGASLEHVIKTTVFLVSMDDYAEMNRIYTEVFGDHRPARSAVAVAALPLGALIEVEAWAWV